MCWSWKKGTHMFEKFTIILRTFLKISTFLVGVFCFQSKYKFWKNVFKWWWIKLLCSELNNCSKQNTITLNHVYMILGVCLPLELSSLFLKIQNGTLKRSHCLLLGKFGKKTWKRKISYWRLKLIQFSYWWNLHRLLGMILLKVLPKSFTCTCTVFQLNFTYILRIFH